MARYIDLDKAIPTAIQACVDVVGHGITQVDAVNIALKFEEIATADVVPKSEVAREIFEELEKQSYYIASEYGDEWKIVDYDDIAELKKKYPEVKKE